MKKVFIALVLLRLLVFSIRADDGDLNGRKFIGVDSARNALDESSANDIKTKKFSSVKPSFKFIADFNAYPYSYETVFSNDSLGLNGRVAFGLGYREFGWTLSMYARYISMGSTERSDSKFFGAQNIFRWTFDFFYRPLAWLELETGIGGALASSSVVYNTAQNIIKNEPAVSFALNTKFILPIKYLDIQIMNQLDLVINERRVAPQYYGGVRAIVHPYLRWIDLYFEPGVYPYYYDDNKLNFTSTLFYFGFGIQFNIDSQKVAQEFAGMKLDIDRIKTKKSAIKDVADDKTINSVSEESTDDKTLKLNKKEYEKPSEAEMLEKLLSAKEGEIIVFDNIIFYPDIEKIKEESYPVLDKIAEILTERKNVVVEIGGYTNSTGNAKEELELSLKRALKAVEYLNSKGVGYERMKATGYGGFVTDQSGITESNRKVEIKIIKIYK